MKPSAFDYHAPTSVEEAVSLLAELGDEAKAIAGGQSLVPMLALRLTAFPHLVDLRKVAGIRGFEQREGGMWVGAATTQSAVERSAEIAERVPLLARATPLIGHFQIRNRGTVGGSLAHADAAAEYPAVALALDAELETASPRGTRTLPAAGFFTGMWTTGLAEDELLTGVRFPVAGPRCGYAVEEFARRRGDFAIAGAAVAIELDPQGRVARCGIGLFGLGPAAQRATAAERAVAGTAVAGGGSDAAAAEVGRIGVAELDSVPSDLHGTAEYRKRVGAAMVARAWQKAVREASGD
ncbi:FAD binding domain-containing protein [Phaeacidiphilus oryzae]|uniref:FAD binding domain-containing protein n=1 Tax=Phaeacidiphilus oryzae TaxID=348818 RepID=UPI00056D5017|nr:FAD binding domain-containing protein [Phaeacidiphilus oryzae]